MTPLNFLDRQWPWPRRLHAKLLASLSAARARVVVFDVLCRLLLFYKFTPVWDGELFAMVVQAYLDSDSCINTEISSFLEIKVTIMPLRVTAFNRVGLIYMLHACPAHINVDVYQPRNHEISGQLDRNLPIKKYRHFHLNVDFYSL